MFLCGIIKLPEIKMAESSVKTLTITGSAAQDALKPRRSGGGSRKQKQPTEDTLQDMPPNRPHLSGGDTTKPVVSLVPAPRTVPTVPTMPEQKQLEAPPIQVQEAGSVILRPPKIQRVKLQPKILHKIPVKGLEKQVASTRKARKIHLTVANLTHRFTRAKKVHAESGAKPMDTIRDFLIGKGVIQPKSKAPEKMLRSMYSDFMLLKDQAL